MKTLTLLCLTGLLAGCAGHRQVRCRITSLDGDHIKHTPWHHGMQDCELGLRMLPELQEKSDTQLNFVLHGTPAQRKEFAERVFGPEKPAAKPVEGDKIKL